MIGSRRDALRCVQGAMPSIESLICVQLVRIEKGVIYGSAIAIAGYLISNPQTVAAQEPQLTIRLIATVDYPGSGNSTTVEGINDLGDVTGYFEDGSGAIRSFIRYADGTVSGPIAEPNDVANVTVARDINNLGEICGYYFSSGHLLSLPWLHFIRHDFHGGPIIGGKYIDSVGSTHGLIFQRPETFSSFDYPGAIETSLNGLNNHQIVSGYFADSSGIHHGFIGKVHE